MIITVGNKWNNEHETVFSVSTFSPHLYLVLLDDFSEGDNSAGPETPLNTN